MFLHCVMLAVGKAAALKISKRNVVKCQNVQGF